MIGWKVSDRNQEEYVISLLKDLYELKERVKELEESEKRRLDWLRKAKIEWGADFEPASLADAIIASGFRHVPEGCVIAVKDRLLKAVAAAVVDDHKETYHQLYYAEAKLPGADPLNPFSLWWSSSEEEEALRPVKDP